MNKNANMIVLLGLGALLGACGTTEAMDELPEGSEVASGIDSAPAVYETVADLSDGPYVFGGDLPEDTQLLVQQAVARINADVGFKAVAFAPGDYFTVGQLVNEPATGTTIAHAFRRRSTGECHVLIGRPAYLGALPSPRQTVDLTTAMHEMLHCLGIGHDEANEESLMFPYRIREEEQPMTEGTKAIIRRMAE